VRVAARSLTGDPIGFTVLTQPGRFDLHIRGDAAEVEVVATGPDGATANARVTRDSPTAALTLR
jgi:hypothetical protein